MSYRRRRTPFPSPAFKRRVVTGGRHLDGRPRNTLRDERNELHVGGPGGVQIIEHSVRSDGSSTHMVTRTHTSTVTDASVDLLRDHPALVAAALGVAGFFALLIPAVVISLLSLSWLFFAAPTVVSVGLFSFATFVVVRARSRRLSGGDSVESALIDAAFRSRGRLTPLAAARETRMTVAKAEAGLMDLARKGHCTPDNDPETGVVVFVFPEIERDPGGSRRLG
jgi:hypothetical protein